jgi:hypothetical protein
MASGRQHFSNIFSITPRQLTLGRRVPWVGLFEFCSSDSIIPNIFRIATGKRAKSLKIFFSRGCKISLKRHKFEKKIKLNTFWYSRNILTLGSHTQGNSETFLSCPFRYLGIFFKKFNYFIKNKYILLNKIIVMK